MAMTDDPTNKLAWMLVDLIVPGVRFAVLLSDDGLRIAHTGDISIADAERFAAGASGLRSLGKALAEFCGAAKSLRQNMTEYDNGMVFITAAGQGALLGISTTADVDISLIAHRMNELAARVGRELASLPRQG
ncbi:putative regulator of Ras-like GTPase activity (Roadblock/LC7/MglB family) [Nocardia pseudobrasiliensis]|uniref:Putative regulator of Ras-like GTPase activity (Roadblock/LC7/MglB family) n=2 Tax=Nocardia pseudobrasiliensis TaxID=45979 RepID=A0A370HPB1_9NOCA|nr:putative regulator of Ras-like GTPase activity (Roadblock/LC7/MglB family) [Nocardia pseudobrasiliensis]